MTVSQLVQDPTHPHDPAAASDGPQILFLMAGILPGNRGAALRRTLTDFGFLPSSLPPAETARRRAEFLCLPAPGEYDPRLAAPSGGDEWRPTTQDGLRARLRTLAELRIGITLGAAAHLALLSAYGMPLNRVPFRAGRLTLLPDGLLLANAPHPLRPRALPSLRALLKKITEKN